MQDLNHDGKDKKQGKMNIFQTSLSMVATSLGVGILGLPYAFYHVGLINGLLLNFALAILAYASAMMYL